LLNGLLEDLLNAVNAAAFTALILKKQAIGS
jgi:hypothetical protein